LADAGFRDVTALGAPDPASFEDTVYLPPVRPEASRWCRDLCGRLASRGLPVLAQLRPGEEPIPEATVIYDLTELALVSDWGKLSLLPRGAAVVWPLIAGLTDRPEHRRVGLKALAGAGARVAMGLVPALSSEERRRLSTLGDEGTFDSLFHGSEPSRLEFARAAARCGLEPFLPRPPWKQPGRAGRNRELAASLSVVGELLLLLDRPEGHAQAFYSAARRVDTGAQDFQAMAREGNLGIVEWLEPAVRREIDHYAAGSEGGLLQELRAELSAGGA